MPYYFIWVFTVCKGTCFGVSRKQRDNDKIFSGLISLKAVNFNTLQLGVRDITGIPVYLDLGVLRYVSRYAFDVPVHSTNSINFRSIVYLLSFRAVIYLHVDIYLTSLDN